MGKDNVDTTMVELHVTHKQVEILQKECVKAEVSPDAWRCMAQVRWNELLNDLAEGKS